jgi:type III restriction enzyme
VVVRDGAIPDAHTLRPKLYHLYRETEVAEDLNRRGAQPHEPLPLLVQQAYTLLGADWREALEAWQASGHSSPPVMLTVCNRIETAARIEDYFNRGDSHWPELQAPNRTLQVNSKVLEKAEVGESVTVDKDYGSRLQAILDAASIPQDRKDRLADLKKEELLRAIVDTVGKRNQAGQDLQNVISVAMLSEGWDAKNVTHIMGLRAFTSQLLCEQVIGRGLRRVGYETEDVVGEDGITRSLFKAEYVNVFGVPLSIFQDVGEGGDAPPPPKPSTQIESLVERSEFEIRWPNVVRVDIVVRPHLHLDWDKVERITIDPSTVPLSADLAPAVGGAADWGKIQTIDLELLPESFRQQRLIFQAARKAFDQLQHGWKGSREYLVVQLIRLVEQFLDSGKIDIPSLFHQDPLRKRILFALCMDRIVQHLMQYIHQQNQERIEPVFDPESPIGSTRYMRTWYTTKPCQPTQCSQISHLVADSAWEAHAANVFESDAHGVRHLVAAYAKNDHLGFQIFYLWAGAKRRYVPDFLVRLSNGKTLILEIKGEKSDQTKAKHAALQAWIQAVNAKGGFGIWCADIAYAPHEMQDIIAKHGGEGLGL